MNKKIVGIYSSIHFIVDLACAILVTDLVMRKMGASISLLIGVLLYNLFAFAVQLPIGIIADKVNKNALCSAFGCILVALAYGLTNYGIICCIIAGIGNAMFHIGGGIDVLNISEKKASLSGIFVSTGAMGIFLGSKSNSAGFDKYYLIIILLLLSAISLIWLYRHIKDEVKNEKVEIPNLNSDAIIAILCLFVTVCIRSYVGFILSFQWKSDIALAILAILAVIFGKMLGGIIGDKIGFKKIAIISLLLPTIGFIFSFENPVIGIISILFFNMTMPITLIVLSNMLDKNKGMAFGLLTFALFIGFLPKFFGIGENVMFTQVGLSIITAISLIVLYIGIKKYEISVRKEQ